MSQNIQNRLQEIYDNGYEFKLGDYISKGYEIFTRNAGLFIGYTIVFFIISSAASMVPLASGVISACLIVGFYIVSHKTIRNEMAQFGDFFKGFDDAGQLILEYIVTLFFMGLLIGIPIFFIFGTGLFEWYLEQIKNPMEQVPFPDINPMSFLIFIPIVLIAIYLGVSWAFAPFFIVFHKMQFWDAMEASRKVIGKNWFMMFIFFIILGFIVIAGMIALCAGLLATMPIALCAQYAAFADITELNTNDDEQDINEHLIV